MKRLAHHYLRLDGRSLGAFRLAMAVVLIADLFGRWRWIKDFYTNEGVLPNHNHLFHLLDHTEVWSALHSVSSAGEAHFAFAIILFVYAGFLIGHHTRVFHALSLVALVSLVGRNVLTASAGDHLAVSLLAVTVLLPLGSRFSVDSLRRSLADRVEKTAKDLNELPLPSEDEVAETHGAGYSPLSLAALGALLLVLSVYVVGAYRQGPEWSAGTALGRAIYWQAWVSDTGVALRGSAEALLGALTFVVWGAGWAIPALVVLPVARALTRGVAAVLALLHAAVLGVLFDLGLYAGALAASSALLLSTETWDWLAARRRRDRACTVIYDADCGICLWLSRFLRRVDAHGHLSFQGNDDLEALVVRRDGAIERVDKPEGVTDELAATSVIVVDHERNVLSRGRAVAAVVRALPFGAVPSLLLRLPGIDTLVDIVYDLIAERRMRLSVLFGWDACGVTPPASSPPPRTHVSRARALFYRLTGSVREVLAVAVVAMVAIQVTRHNDLPEALQLPEVEPLRALATYAQIEPSWDVLVPGVPDEQGILVVDAQTRAGASLDPLTGREPIFDVLAAPRRGPLWSSYASSLRDKRYEPFQKAFREYLARLGGPGFDPNGPIEQRLAGFDVYWVAAPIGPEAHELQRVQSMRMLRYSKGGKLGPPPATLVQPPRPAPVERP